jgi:hypothetical protein
MTLAFSRFTTVLTFLAAGFFAPSARAGGDRVTFSFHDEDYLQHGESAGGLAYVSDGVSQGEVVPLVVFLHGVNVGGALHLWAGGAGTTDLTWLVSAQIDSRSVRPFIFAAPSATRDAMSGRRLWRDFNLDEFVEEVDASLGGRASVARDQVVLAGHSGAGCNPDGGLLRASAHPGSILPIAIVAIDTCLDAEAGNSFGSAPPRIPLFVNWERAAWPRSIEPFLAAFHNSASANVGRAEPTIEEVTSFRARPHDEIVPRTLGSLLPVLLPVTPKP